MNRRNFIKTITLIIFSGFDFQEAYSKGINKPLILSNDPIDEHIKDYLYKMRQYNTYHKDDIFLENKYHLLLKSTLIRLDKIQQHAGYCNFSLIDFDETLKIAENHVNIGKFPKSEKDFLEKIFYENAALYGFYGEKLLKNITDRIKKDESIPISNTGNYLYRGIAFETYKKITKEVGLQAVLTSGIRSIMKQFMLFLSKTYNNNWNLSMASRSLAPPGYSFHGISDFDIGQIGFGIDNFTEKFTTTGVFKKLEELEYVKLRYQQDNMFGVRFEPWHIRVSL